VIELLKIWNLLVDESKLKVVTEEAGEFGVIVAV